MKKFFSVLLSIIFAVCLLATLLLGIVRTDFSYSAITKIASEILKPVSKIEPVNDGLFHPGDVKFSLAGYEETGDFGDFDMSQIDLSSIDLANLDVNELVETYLEAAGVDVEPEFIAEVLASPDVSEFVDKYVGEVVNYMTGASEELTINPEDITILSQKKKEDSVVSMLENSSIKDFKVPLPLNTTFCTVQAFKGLENKVIILTDVESFSSEKLMYVGLSRACTGLFILESESAKREYDDLVIRRIMK